MNDKISVPSVVNNTQINIMTEEAPALLADTITKKWDELGLTLTHNGAPIINIDNALKIFERGLPKDLIWFDSFHNRYFTNFDFNTLQKSSTHEWTDINDLALTSFFQRNIGLSKITDEMVRKAALLWANKQVKNEPVDWISSLKWDGVDRCEMFLSDCLGVEDSHYSRCASLNFWISLVARIFNPGCQVDNMIVLEGSQGIGKTRALRTIGGKWHTEIKESVTEKDFFLSLQGKLIVEIAEMDSFNKAEITRIKHVISCVVDRFRAPYASSPQDYPRRCIFAGTTNESSYLRDDTGARRFWPIKCGDISISKIESLRESLFAEAAAKLKSGFTWWEMPQSDTEKEQEKRRQTDLWEDSISYYLIGKNEVSLDDIIRDSLEIKIKDADRRIQLRIANILRLLKFERISKWSDGKSHKVWKRIIPENGTFEELNK